jgi:gamma-glutamyltranspeptidase / glutathione hydrolase
MIELPTKESGSTEFLRGFVFFLKRVALFASVSAVLHSAFAAPQVFEPSVATPTQTGQAPSIRTHVSALGAISTVHPLATEAALKQLELGGNAIDASIAAALALGVVDGFNSGIGGGLFVLVHRANGQIDAIDAREMAPAAAHRDMYVRNGKVDSNLSRHGALAIGIPGSVAAFEYMSSKAGRRPLSDIYDEAARLAEDGFTLDWLYQQRLERTAKQLAQFEHSAAIFLDPHKQPLKAGVVLKQKDLAKTYRRIGKQGADYFYKGEFALLAEGWIKANGGIVTAEDFSRYTLKLRTPLRTPFGQYELIGFPPPSSGGVHVAQILGMVKALDYETLPAPHRRHVLAQAMKLAFADRAHWLGDPDFVEVPKGLVSGKYIAKQSEKIDMEQASDVERFGTPEGVQTDLFDRHTTHISVADAMGNWVSMTTTINTSFGSKVVVPGTGVVMNNQMDDFAAQPNVPNLFGLVGSEANRIEPGKRPLSSMSPTLVLKDGKPMMAIGAAGGSMIISQVAQAILNHLLLGQPLLEAIATPRIHHQWKPDAVFYEDSVPQTELDYLKALGHPLSVLKFEGSTTAVVKTSDGFVAVSEPRLDARNSPKTNPTGGAFSSSEQ